jgi:hypothetical protein
MADATDLKSVDRKVVRVRLPPPAPRVFHQVIGIFLVLALYRLFKAVNERHAVLLVILGSVVSLPIVFLNVLNEIAALALVSAYRNKSAFDRSRQTYLTYKQSLKQSSD